MSGKLAEWARTRKSRVEFPFPHHAIENLYVTDGSSFPSQGTANPTLTLMALTFRATEDLASRL